MNNARESILKNISQACAQINDAPAMPTMVIQPPPLSTDQQINQFIEKAKKAKAEVILGDWQTLNKQLPFYCEQYHISELYCAKALQSQLHLNPLFNESIHNNIEMVNESAAIVQAHYGLYETGTVVCLSTTQPSNALFLPQHLFVVLSTKSIVWDMATAYAALKNQQLSPRMINFITGPSCTADIEQTLLYGAHGPKTLTIFLIKE